MSSRSLTRTTALVTEATWPTYVGSAAAIVLARPHRFEEVAERSEVTDFHADILFFRSYCALLSNSGGVVTGFNRNFHAYGPFKCHPRSAATPYDARLGAYHDQVCTLATTFDKVVVIRKFVELKGIDVGSRNIFQGSEYEVVDVLIAKTESGDYQERIVLFKKSGQTVGKCDIRLLS